MKHFSTLIQRLENTNKTNAKIDAIVDYLRIAHDADKLWLLRLFAGKRPKRPVNTNLLRTWVLELTGYPEWLFIECYSSVGDLGETISLILPPPTTYLDQSLSQWMQDLATLQYQDDDGKKAFVTNAWDSLDIAERFIFNKLIGGSFRIGVSQKLFISAIAKYAQLDDLSLTHSIMGIKDWDTYSFDEVINGVHVNTDNSKPYPFCLAYPLEKGLSSLGDIQDWQVEYKWDGIRGQLVKRNGEVHIWSRGEELVTATFPEIKDVLENIPGDFVLDGEILVVKDGEVLNFNELQKRLNRKTITKKMQETLPIKVKVYDLIEWQGEDIREKLLSDRRALLEAFFQHHPVSGLLLSPLVQVSDWDALTAIREGARALNSEGLMLKHRDSIYHTGRKKGDWWKWKVNPLTIDAVLIYAQKGSGRRSAHYTDYTFAVRDGDALVTIAKAYSGLTDKEIVEVSKFVNQHAIEKFGPVRTVKPELVFEIAFEGIGYSIRHKSGVALRFPRILRWRKDKTVADIDDVASVKALIQ